MSERDTEQIVRNHLDGCISNSQIDNVRYSEQIPKNPRIKKLLAKASKSGGGGAGHPEFIVEFSERPEFIIVIECKASLTHHQSDRSDRPKDYAVDGVLHYASHLTSKYNVLAIAVSGTDIKKLKVSHYFCFRGGHEPESAFGNELLPLQDYLKTYTQHESVFKQDLNELLSFTKELNGHLHALKVKETNRSLLISAILTALRCPEFQVNYSAQTGKNLLSVIKDTTLSAMKGAQIQKPTMKSIKTSYAFMDAPTNKLTDGNELVDLISQIDAHINSFQKTHKFYDVLGQLYVEFLRYSNSDKGLGIVLTPPHITELAIELAQVDKNDVLYDNCAGTGGFLISGMKKMISQANENIKVVNKIKKNNIIGVEYQSDISSLLCSNMFIHGDGRSNVFQGDCFDSAVIDRIREKFHPTVGMLNPPFKGEKNDIEEMDFVINNLNSLRHGGRCVALLPMQCALAHAGQRLALKELILSKHTLEAVLSLPNELFHSSKASVVTCLMVFTVGQPHPPNKETWFGYCKDDGFVKQKPYGRGDHYGCWETIKEKWVSGFINRKSTPGFSVMQKVCASDEWCAEAYIETDYTNIGVRQFQEIARNFAIYQIKSGE